MRLRLFSILLTAVATAGCNPLEPDLFDIDCGESRMSVVSGNHQTGVAGTALEKPLVVAAGPVSPSMFCTGLGSTFVWTVESGGGSVAPASTVPAGASWTVMWTLGPVRGKQTVRATWTNSGQTTAPFVIFEATAID